MLIGIPVVGFLLTFVFHEENVRLFTASHLVHGLISTFVTAINWLVCRYIVIKFWNKYPWHIKPLQHILIEVTVLILFTVFMMCMNALVFIIWIGEPLDIKEITSNTIVILILVFGLVTYHEALFFYYQWKENFNKSTLLEKANLEAEFDVLKSQVNPHFLFNSLNTLTTYVEDNPDAVEYIQTLSIFLRYSFDDGYSGLKSLKEEIEIVRKYIKLQRYRYEDELKVDINIETNYMESLLPSLSLQTLVENAIKHNVISNNKPLNIQIFIENETYVVIENNLQVKQEINSTNKGLKNLINRYSFVSEKEIIISEKNNKFTVKLPLL